MAGGKKGKLASDSMADSGTTDKKFDYKLKRMANSRLPKGSDKIVDYEKLKRMAGSRLPKGSDKKFDYEKLKRMAGSLLPKGSDKIVDERAFNALPVSRDVDEVRLQLSREEVAAVEFNNKRFYKFYPVPTS